MHLSLTIVTFTEMCTSPPRSLEKKQKKKKERKSCMHMTSCHIAKTSVSTSQGSSGRLIQRHLWVLANIQINGRD